MGLSPRVRGNLAGTTYIFVGSRTIPARAGEPQPPYFMTFYYGDYPRACGGTFPIHARFVLTKGLSPRVRGNPTSLTGSIDRVRTIPARAGEPFHPG